MSASTVFLITGANRGIGLHLTSLLLTRSNTTVVATVRSQSTSVENVSSLPRHATSNLIIRYLSTDDINTPEALRSSLASDHNITRIDVLIVNAASSSFRNTLETSTQSVMETFMINTFLPIALFQTMQPLLANSDKPKFIYISSSLGSINGLDQTGQMPILAYGAAKAASGYFTRKIHYEFADIVSVTIHPGWIKTDFGQQFADSIGVTTPPHELRDTVEQVLQQIDSASRETTSGTFIKWDGEVIPW